MKKVVPTLTPGSESTENKWLKILTAICVLIAIAGSFGSVPFTPGEMTEWIQKVSVEAAKWMGALSVPLTAAWSWYASLRTGTKKELIKAQTKVAIHAINAEKKMGLVASAENLAPAPSDVANRPLDGRGVQTAVLVCLMLLFTLPHVASAGQITFGWTASPELEAVEGYMIHYGPSRDNVQVGVEDCGLPYVLDGHIAYTADYPDTAECFAISAYRVDVNGPLSDVICLQDAPGPVAKFKLLIWVAPQPQHSPQHLLTPDSID